MVRCVQSIKSFHLYKKLISVELNEFYHLLNFASNEIFLAKFVFGVWQLWVAVVTESSEGNDTPKTAAMIIERNF